MNVLYARCAGVDVHKASISVCLLVPGPDGRPRKEVRTCATTTAAVLECGDWLAAAGCTQVAMESTGVYWKPLWNLWEERFTLLLVNAQHVKALPGRKTDVRDCEWLADLLRHGLLRASFVPDRPQRELRELTRYRAQLVGEHTAGVNRVQKTLEGANIKLATVATDIMGVSGRAMLRALAGGETDAAVLANLAVGRLRSKLPELERALAGRFEAHQRFLIAEQLAHLDAIEASIERLTTEISARLTADAQALERLDTIPGVGQRVAETVVAEIGTDLTRFPSAAHLVSWAGLCPGNNESAGKRRSGKTRKGNPSLRRTLIEAAQAAGRTKETYLGAQYRRLAARRGSKKAAVAVAHSILVIIYCMLRDGTPYQDLGADYFLDRDRQGVKRRAIRHLETLGFQVTLQPLAAD